MKKLFVYFALISFLSNTLLATGLKVATSYENAIDQGIQQNKHIILFAQSPSCPWCEKMEEETFSDQRVIYLLNEHYIFLSVNMSSQSEIENIPAKFLPRGTPTTFIIDPHTEELLYTMRGFKSAKNVLFRLSK
jgi:thioredoxin-related protein